MTLTTTAHIDGDFHVTERAVIGILDKEAGKATREAAKFTRNAIRDGTPVGPGRGGKHLRDQHRFSARRQPYGYKATFARTADGWYGRIVEGGRQPGESRGRRYPGARANPYIERTMGEVEHLAEGMLEAGGDRAGDRILREVF